MNIYLLLGVAVAWAMYLPMCKGILSSTKKQNLATFILWGILEAEVAVSLLVQGGNWLLPAGYVAGCIATILCILKMKTFSWGWFESLCATFVVLCAIAWAASGPYLAAIISTVGVVIAGLPQLKDAHLAPREMPLGPYVGFVIANTLSTYGGASWTVEERLYAGACTILCAVIVGVTLFGLYVRPYLKYRSRQFI